MFSYLQIYFTKRPFTYLIILIYIYQIDKEHYSKIVNVNI